jgi:hypothetical protein
MFEHFTFVACEFSTTAFHFPIAHFHGGNPDNFPLWASGNIVTKLRCSINDDTLDAISFLRSHFINTDTEQQQKK